MQNVALGMYGFEWAQAINSAAEARGLPPIHKASEAQLEELLDVLPPGLLVEVRESISSPEEETEILVYVLRMLGDAYTQYIRTMN